MNHQPTVISVCHSVYKSHHMPPIRPVMVEPMDAHEAIELYEYVISALKADELSYSQAQKSLAFDPSNAEHIEQKRRAQQAMNLLISMKKKELAQAMGLTEREFISRFLPQKMDQLWFCVPPQRCQLPSEFLAAVLCALRKQSEKDEETV